jgi:uncharacterized protein with NRDE domain
MCLILFSWQSHPQYPLVVLANRDEFYERKTQAMHWWDDHPEVLAGRDLADVKGQAGTWMGLTSKGKFSALTNIRAPSEKNPDLRTRGELPHRYLTSPLHSEDFVSTYGQSFHRYNGFNLLMTDLSYAKPELYWMSNRIAMGKDIRPRKVMTPHKLSPGSYGLSNAMLDTPWPKVQHRIAAFSHVLGMDTGNFKKPESYLQIMQDSSTAEDDKLPSTGVSYEWEKALSAAFIQTEHYGTRSTSLLRVAHDGSFECIERTYDAQQEVATLSFAGQIENFASVKT